MKEQKFLDSLDGSGVKLYPILIEKQIVYYL